MGEVNPPSSEAPQPGDEGVGILVERFREAWKRGSKPRIDEYLPPASGDRLLGLLELSQADLQLRIEAGETARVEDYLKRYGALAENRRSVLDLIITENEARQKHERQFQPGEYKDRFPELWPQILESVGTLFDSQWHLPRLVKCPRCGAEVKIGAPARVNCPRCGTRVHYEHEEPNLFFRPGTIPGYEVLRELGRGSMGIVYKARHLAGKGLVAIKVIRKELLSSHISIRRFRREAKAAVQLTHPNIVRVYEANQASGHHYLIMEYLDGDNLQAHIDRHGPMDVPWACACIRQVALGLDHAFLNQIVHRDIKPANVMLLVPADKTNPRAFGKPSKPATNQEGMVVKILDMGLARFKDHLEQELSGTLTPDSLLVGTPDFMSPEQAENPRDADVRADLYSLGCTFYFLLTGTVPFPGGTWLQKLDRHRFEVPRPVDAVRPEVPAGVAQIVTKLLAKQPQERYQTPAELAAALACLPLKWKQIPPARSAIVPSKSGQDPDTPVALKARPNEVALTDSQAEVGCFKGHRAAVHSVNFSPAGRLAFSGSLDHTAAIWGLASGRELRRANIHKGAVFSVAFFPTGRFALSASEDCTIRFWEVDTCREVLRFDGHSAPVMAAVFSPDRRRVLSCAADHTIRLWDAGGNELRRFEGHDGPVHQVAFAPDGSHFLSAGADQTVRLWETRTAKPVRCFIDHSGPVYSVAFSPAGRWALSASADHTIRLWDLFGGCDLRGFRGHAGPVRSVAFSPDGRRALSGSEDGTVRLWDIMTGKELRRFQGHEHAVFSVAISASGRYALSGSADATIRFWILPP